MVPKCQLREFKDQSNLAQYKVDYPSNKVRTTRYTIFSFLPVSIMLQYTKVINCFWLISLVLQSIPSISTNDWRFSLIPVICLPGLGVIKEGLADYKRWKQDRKLNSAPCVRLTGKSVSSEHGPTFETETIRTDALAVGDIIQV